MSKVINIILEDGSPRGIRQVDLLGRSTKCFVIPRSRIREAAKINELSIPGIYVLIGYQEDQNEPMVYIGEAENVFSRITDHSRDTKKDFWNIALCFVAKDGLFDKAKVKFLEHHALEYAKKINRCVIQNSSRTSAPKLSGSDNIVSAEIFENIKLLVSVMGYPIFEEIKESDSSGKLYFCSGPDAKAQGRYTDDGFIVLKGSLGRLYPAKASVGRVNVIQRKLFDQKVIKSEKNTKSFSFIDDYMFNSPSAAADLVLGRSANGWTEWKDKDKKTLNENERVKKLNN